MGPIRSARPHVASAPTLAGDSEQRVSVLCRVGVNEQKQIHEVVDPRLDALAWHVYALHERGGVSAIALR